MAGDEERTRERAHELWLQAGRPDGQAEHFWLAAEQEVSAGETVYDEALADSFPASDPPGNSGITGPETVEHPGSKTTAGEPAAGADPGGTRPRRKSTAQTTAPQTVISGDRNDAPAARR